MAVTIAGINYSKIIQERSIFLFEFGRMLRYPHRCTGGIFVPGIMADQISVAFFGAQDKVIYFAFSFNMVHQIADIFEADKQIPNTSNLIFFGNFLNE